MYLRKHVVVHCQWYCRTLRPARSPGTAGVNAPYTMLLSSSLYIMFVVVKIRPGVLFVVVQRARRPVPSSLCVTCLYNKRNASLCASQYGQSALDLCDHGKNCTVLVLYTTHSSRLGSTSIQWYCSFIALLQPTAVVQYCIASVSNGTSYY
jgi:hypothetical protein